MDASTDDYPERWESYWQYITLRGTKAKVLWDSIPEQAALQEIGRFRKHMDVDLPLLDVGCGSGWYTRFLARHFQAVIGIDLSSAAIDLARQQIGTGCHIEYRVLNASNPPEAKAFHCEVGDVNIHLRGVLHGIQHADRPSFIAGLVIMLGERGTLYQLEVMPAARMPMKKLRLGNLFVASVGFDNACDREACYPVEEWQVLEQGQDTVTNIIDAATGEEQTIPVNYLIVRRKPHA
jgi:SAM-dependent methyltransferase